MLALCWEITDLDAWEGTVPSLFSRGGGGFFVKAMGKGKSNWVNHFSPEITKRKKLLNRIV